MLSLAAIACSFELSRAGNGDRPGALAAAGPANDESNDPPTRSTKNVAFSMPAAYQAAVQPACRTFGPDRRVHAAGMGAAYNRLATCRIGRMEENMGYSWLAFAPAALALLLGGCGGAQRRMAP